MQLYGTLKTISEIASRHRNAKPLQTVLIVLDAAKKSGITTIDELIKEIKKELK